MQATKKTIALIETAAGNVDAAYQRAILTRYAELQQLEIGTTYGERAPLAGTAAAPDHRDVINDIKSGGVGRLLILADVRHAVPEAVLAEADNAGVEVKFVDVQQERGLSQVR
jgi:hypothetical protein